MGTTRARLVDATEAVMRETSPLDVRVEQVARRAGCSRATVYRHVADKDELVRAVLVRHATRLADQLETEIDDAGDPADWIAEGMVRNTERVRQEPWYQALEQEGASAAIARLCGGPQAIVEFASPLVARFLSRLEQHGVLRTGLSVEDATEWLVLVHVGLLTLDIATRRTHAQQVAFVREFVAGSLLAPAPPGR
jgi:AcrR family transcriptional regulator